MSRASRSPVSALLLLLTLLALPAGTRAQEVAEMCDGSSADDAAIVGVVREGDSDMLLPGATVVASWEENGPRQQTTVQSGLDGSYVVCGLRPGLSVTLLASFSTLESVAKVVELADGVTRADLALSLAMSSSAEPTDRRLIMCPDFEFPHLIDCEPGQYLDRCEHEKLGRVETGRAGAAVDAQETVEQFIYEVKRLGGDAVIDVDVQSRYGSLWRIEGMAVKLADPTCRAGGSRT